MGSLAEGVFLLRPQDRDLAPTCSDWMMLIGITNGPGDNYELSFFTVRMKQARWVAADCEDQLSSYNLAEVDAIPVQGGTEYPARGRPFGTRRAMSDAGPANVHMAARALGELRGAPMSTSPLTVPQSNW